MSKFELDVSQRIKDSWKFIYLMSIKICATTQPFRGKYVTSQLMLDFVHHYVIMLIQTCIISCVPVAQWLEHCVSSAKGWGFDSHGTHADKTCIAWMHCKSIWIKASAKCINVNVIISFFQGKEKEMFCNSRVLEVKIPFIFSLR